MDTIGRRDFFGLIVKGFGTLVGAMLSVPLGGYLLSPILRKDSAGNWVSLGNMDRFPLETPTRVDFSYEKEDGWMKAVVDRYAFVLRKANGLAVFSPICTHLGCSVSWDGEKKNFQCPCHGGVYSPAGKVIAGPPPKALTQFDTKVEEGKLFIRVV
jgi:menaquinol-cytochrome c reductase iron-sulfur subunit